MSDIKKYLRTRQIKKRAHFIAMEMGESIANGWKYDDKKMCIVAQQYETIVYYTGKKGKREKVFFFCSAPKAEYYHEGEWEHYFDTCYKTAKTRPK